MPNMDGLQATQRIREVERQEGWSRLPILGLTAHAIHGYHETCLSHGMDGYLGKPFNIKQLLVQMVEILPPDKKLLRDEG
jgi:osomolarity two-component system sensor histidine kinase NIK1